MSLYLVSYPLHNHLWKSEMCLSLAKPPATKRMYKFCPHGTLPLINMFILHNVLLLQGEFLDLDQNYLNLWICLKYREKIPMLQ